METQEQTITQPVTEQAAPQAVSAENAQPEAPREPELSLEVKAKIAEAEFRAQQAENANQAMLRDLQEYQARLQQVNPGQQQTPEIQLNPEEFYTNPTEYQNKLIALAEKKALEKFDNARRQEQEEAQREIVIERFDYYTKSVVKDTQESIKGYVSQSGTAIPQSSIDGVINTAAIQYMKQTGSQFIRNEMEKEYFQNVLVPKVLQENGFQKVLPMSNTPDLTKDLRQSQTGYSSQFAGLPPGNSISQLEAEFNKAKETAQKSPTIENLSAMTKASFALQDAKNKK